MTIVVFLWKSGHIFSTSCNTAGFSFKKKIKIKKAKMSLTLPLKIINLHLSHRNVLIFSTSVNLLAQVSWNTMDTCTWQLRPGTVLTWRWGLNNFLCLYHAIIFTVKEIEDFLATSCQPTVVCPYATAEADTAHTLWIIPPHCWL